MATTTFRESIKRILPPWWLGKVGEALVHSILIVLDTFWRWIDLGIKARFPGHPECTPTALKYIGNDRLLERFPAETDTAYAGRLRAWLDTWRVAGNAKSIIDQIYGYLGGGAGVYVRIAHNRGRVWYVQDGTAGTFTITTNSAPGNFNWDNQDSRWWRFWVIITVPVSKWADGPHWGDGGETWGKANKVYGQSKYTPAEVSAIRAIVDRWKPAHAVCPWILINMGPLTPPAPTFFMPGSTAGSTNPNGDHANWSKYSGGIQVPARLTQADYWDGVS